MNTFSRQLRALALLLDYPQIETHTHLTELGMVLTPLYLAEAKGSRESLLACIAGMAASDLMDLQADFVDTFDRGRSTSLNLFEHIHGDSRDRGQAMVDLLAQYQEIGLNLQTNELPDYLPIYLEYASVLDPVAAHAALEEIVHLVAHITAALERRESPWVAVTAAICRLAGASNWRSLIAQETHPETQSSVTETADVQRANPHDDWTPEGLDAVWAEEPVNFLGTCGAQQQVPFTQPIQFVPHATQSEPTGA
jgi:nitrate reductase delta subunit